MNDAFRGPESANLHPAFYVVSTGTPRFTGHWMLARLLDCPGPPEAGQIRAALNQNLTAPHLRAEVVLPQSGERQSFEGPTAWAWLLKLAEELRGWMIRMVKPGPRTCSRLSMR